MRIVLKHLNTALYMQGANAWVRSPHEAQSFLNPMRALQFCVLHNLPAEIVTVLEESDLMEAHPITEQIMTSRKPALRRLRELW